VCIGCTEIGSVDGGTTRYVVEQVNPGENCYRIAASVGEIKSLYSPPTCITVPTAEEAAAAAAAEGGADAAGGADGAGGAGGAGGDAAPAGPPPPCEPVLTEARVVSPTSLAILWQPATEPPKGWTAPEPSASPAADSKMRGGDTSAKGDASGAGGAGGDAADAKVCDPAVKITGWSIQRKIFTGWSDVTPEPKPNDTAIEVADLEPGTKYCFRMAAKSATGDSRYTKKFCATTPPAAEASPSPSATTSPSPSTSQPVQDAPA
jgi:hypothetical protein